MDLLLHETIARQVKSLDQMLNQLPPARRARPADALAALDFGKLEESLFDQKGLACVCSPPDELALTFAQRYLETLHFCFATNQPFEQCIRLVHAVSAEAK